VEGVCGAESAMPCLKFSALDRERQREIERKHALLVVCAPVLVLITKPENSTPKNANTHSTHTHTHTHDEQ